MDFHTLARRELQALCKKNKIPANMTNVAMAEALQALQTVDGLEELLANPDTEYLKTPARSSVARTATRRTVARKKDVPDAAPPSACTKGGNKSTMSQAYNTRRSTRLLEKQMSELSLKEKRGDAVDTKSDLEKDSSALQRKFSADLDNTQDSEAGESNAVSDATEESGVVVDYPGQSMDEVLEKEQSLVDGIADSRAAESLEKNDPENVNNEFGQTKNLASASTVDVVEEPGHEDVVKHLEEAPQIEVSCDDSETRQSLNGTDVTMDDVPQLTATEVDVSAFATKEETSSRVAETQQVTDTEEEMPDHVAVNGQEILGFEADPNAGGAQGSASPVVASEIPVTSVDKEVVIEDSQLNLKPTTLKADVGDVPMVEDESKQRTASQMKAPEATEDEFYFLSESENDGDSDQEVDGIQDINEAPAPADNEAAPEPLLVVEAADLGSLDQNNGMANAEIKIKSSPVQVKSPLVPKDQSPSKVSAPAHHNVPKSDNKENIEVAMRKMSVSQDETSAPIGTPIDKKSIRQLRKILKSFKQKEEKKRPALQACQENIVAGKLACDN